MLITKVELQKNNDYRYNVYINDEFAFGVTDEIKYKYNLKKGVQLDNKTLNEILELEKQNKALNYVLYLLSFRSRSEKEIKDKLIEKEYLDHQIDYAINYCKERNYINDYDFASSFVRDKLRINKYGPNKIKYQLIQKGVSESIINEVLDEYIDIDEQYNSCYELANKQIKKYKKDDKHKQYNKLSAYLYRRGYSYDLINSIVKKVINDAKEQL